MRKSENGSVTMIVVVTIMFILIMLSANLIYVSSKRRSQLQESGILQNIYKGDGLENAYQERLKKENIVNETSNTEQTPETVGMDQIEQFDQTNETNQANQTNQTNETNKSNATNETNQANETSQINQIN